MNGVLKTLVIVSTILCTAFANENKISEERIQSYDENIVQMTCIEKVDEIVLSDDEVDLIALITMAEAEGECEYGKRLVIDTILNRLLSENYPNTIEEVIYQPYHFESVWNGRVDRCTVDEDIVALVREELYHIRNKEVMYFCAGDYSEYGVPMFQVENHYFSREE